MDKFDILPELRSFLAPSSLSRIVAALYHDRQIWSDLQGDFGVRAIDLFRKRAEDITPALLSLLAISYPEPVEALQHQPMRAAREDFRTMPDEVAYTHPQLNLVNAGYEALEARELRRESGSWIILGDKLTTLSKTAGACLYGMIPDPDEFLLACLRANRGDLIVHSLLCHPLPDEPLSEVLLAVLEVAPSNLRVGMLVHLVKFRPAIAVRLASTLIIDASTPPDLLNSTGGSHTHRLSSLFYRAEIHRLANMHDEAFQALEEADQELIDLQANQTKQTARLERKMQKRAQEIMRWQRALEQNPDDPETRGYLALAHLELGNRDEAFALLGQIVDATQPIHPAALLAKIELEKERLTVRDGIFWVAEWLPSHEPDSQALQGSQLELYEKIAEKLHATGFSGPAMNAVSRALIAQPENPRLLNLQASILQSAGFYEKALQPSQLACVLDPGNSIYTIQLASIFEDLSQYQQVVQEIESAIENTPDSPVEYQYMRAKAWIQNNEPEKAIQCCRQLLEQDDADQIAYVILGEACVQMGDLDSARLHFERASQIDPKDPQPWLALADMYAQTSDLTKAIETLQEACVEQPKQPRLLLKIGEYNLQNGAPTQALKSLREAEKMLEKMPGAGSKCAQTANWIDIRLGQALAQLGHVDSARQILNRVYLCIPGNLELTRAYTEILMRSQDYELALAPIESILERRPGDLQAQLDFAQCVLRLEGPVQRENLDAALLAIDDVLKAEHAPELAYGILAELLYIKGDYDTAMNAYRKALETDLKQQDEWKLPLMLGLGKSALAAGHPETAIAALQAAQADFPYNPEIAIQLSESFEAGDLIEESYLTAKEALSLAANDHEILIWFAEQAQSLKSLRNAALPQALEEACGALSHAVRLAPQNGNLLVKLVELQIQKGDHEDARSTLQLVIEYLSAPDEANELVLSIGDLYRAGECMLAIGDPAGAAVCWQEALRTYPSVDQRADAELPAHLNLLTSLASAYRQNGDMYKSLETIAQAIEKYPKAAQLYKSQADILLELARDTYTDESQRDTFLSEALDSLERGLQENPEDQDINLLIAYIHRIEGNLLWAFEKARSVYTNAHETNHMMAARLLAAEITTASLHDHAASMILEWTPPTTETLDRHAAVSFYCARAELALEVGDLDAATSHATRALEVDPDHPRFLALQSRLTARRDSSRTTAIDETSSWDSTAKEIFQSAMQGGLKDEAWVSSNLELWPFTVDPEHSLDSGTIRALIEAALELKQWQPALELSNQLSRIAPHEPLSHLSLARALVLRAEYQQLCQDFKILRRAPGMEALSENCSHEFAQAILKSEENIQITRQDLDRYNGLEYLTNDSDSSLKIRKWQARGLAIFQPGAESEMMLEELPQTVEDVISRIVCLRRVGNITKAGVIGRSYPRHPFVLAQIALSLQGSKPKQALAAAHAAQEILGQIDENNPASYHAYSRAKVEDIALINVLLAMLVIHNGSRLGDPALALRAIQTALAHWPDEPRWHALAAEINLRHDGGDELSAFRAAISHLEQAIRLEPNQASYHLTLGKLYLQEKHAFADQELAIKHIERACQLSPDLMEPWLLLARAHLSRGELDLAASRAERAVGLGPEEIEPLLLRAEIALRAGNPRGALSRVQTLLQIHEAHPGGLVLMAKALMALERPAEALETIERAIPVSSDPLALHMERVRLIMRINGPETAIEALERLLEVYPNQPEILASMARAQEQAGNTDAAIFAAQRTLRTLSDEGTAIATEIAFEMNYMLGRLLGKAGQLDQAVHYLSEAVHLQPGEIEPFLELGNVHKERRQFTQALHFYKQAINLAPNDYRGYYLTGMALKESRDYLGAENMLRKASDLDPDNLMVRRTLGAVVALNLVHNRRGVGQELQI